MNRITRIKCFIDRNGIGNTIARVMKYASPGYRRYHIYRDRRYRAYARNNVLSEAEKCRQRETDFAYKPWFSILVPLYDTDQTFLEELIKSVKEQTYVNWELCFSDGSKDKNRLSNILKPYIDSDDRIKLVNKLEGPLGISSNTNQAYSIMTGDYVVLGDHDDLFTPDALFECAKALNDDNTIDVIYTDEDKTDSKGRERFNPNYKSDFNIDEIGCCNYITHMFVVKNSLVSKVGLLKEEFNGAQDYDFILRVTEQAENICHIPRVLYNWRVNETSTAGNAGNKLYAYTAGANALQEHYDRLGLPVKVSQSENPGFYNPVYDLSDEPLLSVIFLPPENSIEASLLVSSAKCIKEGSYKNIQLILPEGFETESGDINIDRSRNESYVNQTLERAEGDYILLLDPRAYLHSENAISDMLGILHRRNDVGAIGPKIFDGNGYFRHAGVIYQKGAMPCSEYFIYEKHDDTLIKYKDYTGLREFVFMTKKKLLLEAGGLSTEYENYSYSIMDYCLKLRDRGVLSVYNGTNLFGYATKGAKKKWTDEDIESLGRDRSRFARKWKKLLSDGDPYYPLSKHKD